MGDDAHTLTLTTDLKMRVVFYESFPLLRQSLTAGMSAFITDSESNEHLVWMSSASLTVWIRREAGYACPNEYQSREKEVQ